VADTYNQTIRKVAAGAVVTTLAGVGGMAGYSDTAPALFDFPAGLATDAAGNVYVGDAVNSAVREITPAGTVSTPAKGLPIMSPNGVAVDEGGNVYVADVRGNSILKVAMALPARSLARGTRDPTTGTARWPHSAIRGRSRSTPQARCTWQIPATT